MTHTNTTIAEPGNTNCNPSLCETESFFDREVELLICKESKNCNHKHILNKKLICTCKNAR
jgi:hypothetical protein